MPSVVKVLIYSLLTLALWYGELHSCHSSSVLVWTWAWVTVYVKVSHVCCQCGYNLGSRVYSYFPKYWQFKQSVMFWWFVIVLLNSPSLASHKYRALCCDYLYKILGHILIRTKIAFSIKLYLVACLTVFLNRSHTINGPTD